MRVFNPVHPPKACAPLDPNYNSVPSKYSSVVASLNRLVSRVVTFVPVWIEVMFFVQVCVCGSYTPCAAKSLFDKVLDAMNEYICDSPWT